MTVFWRAGVLDEISSGVRSHLGAQGWVLWALLAGIALLVGVMLVARRFLSPETRLRRSRRRLLKRILEASRLPAAERAAIARIGRHYRMPNPVELVVRRSLFESGAQALGLAPAAAEAIRRKLYS